MNILFVNSGLRLFDRLDCGGAFRSTMFVRALARLGHVDVVSFFIEPLTSNVENCDVVFSEHIPVREIPRNRILSLAEKLHNHIDVWNPHSYNGIVKKREEIIDEIYHHKKYDIVACRYIEDAATCGLVKYAPKLVVDVDDNPKTAAISRLAYTDYPNPWSRYTTLYRAHAIGLMANSFLDKVLCSFHSNRLESPCKKSVYLPNVPIMRPHTEDVSEQTPMRLLFVGLLDYYPNRLGTQFFVEKIFPSIRKQIPNIELRIVGKTIDRPFKDALNAIPGVEAVGFVEDLEKEYRNARICIAPVYHGAGTSVKFVEALSMRRAVVSTPMGVRGFDDICKDKRDYILAQTDEAFVKEIVSLVTDIDRLNRIASSGYKVVSENFSQECFFNIIKNAIRKSLQTDKT